MVAIVSISLIPAFSPTHPFIRTTDNIISDSTFDENENESAKHTTYIPTKHTWRFLFPYHLLRHLLSFYTHISALCILRGGSSPTRAFERASEMGHLHFIFVA